jgi:hypothetical protein
MRTDGGETSGTSSATTHDTQNTFVFARHQNGLPVAFTDARLAFYSIGSAIPDLAALDNRVSTLVTEIAAAIP